MNVASARRPTRAATRARGGLALRAFLLLAPGFLLGQDQEPPASTPTPFQESVTVDRVVVDGRVIDRFANTVPGLTKENFRLKVDGIARPIESADYTAAGESRISGGTEPGMEREPASAATTTAAGTWIGGSSRLVVILFQWEIAGQKDVGFIRVMRQAIRFIDTAQPSDRIAVLGYGSSLRLLTDFTTDRSLTRRAVLKVRSLGSPLSGSGGGEPKLAAGLGRCQSTNTIERALTCVGRSLQDVAGPKVLLFCGWATESHRSSWRTDYPSVIEAISKAQTSVFVLDVSDGSHRLAAGLKLLAADTGGLYNETYDFPDLARLRVSHALKGSYEIVFQNPRANRGWHTIEIELVGATGNPIFSRWYND